MEKDPSLERLAAAICPIVLDAPRGLAAHPEDRDAAWEMEGNVLSSIMEAAAAEPCQYNGQRNRRFLCGQHGFRIGLEGIPEAVEELLHGLCRHAVPDGFVRTEAVVV